MVVILKTDFILHGKRGYRYFIEDDPKNAIKLASTCEYVFLLEQPYNNQYYVQEEFWRPEENDKLLPPNVIRVKNWYDIKNKIRELG